MPRSNEDLPDSNQTPLTDDDVRALELYRQREADGLEASFAQTTPEDEAATTDGGQSEFEQPEGGSPQQLEPLTETQLGYITEHRWLARYFANKYRNRGIPSEDLRQVADLALVKAARGFDPELGNKFTTFAAPTIVGELKRYFRDRTWDMKVSRRQKDTHLQLRRANQDLTHQLGRHPTIAELADHLEISEDAVLEAKAASSTHWLGSLSVGSHQMDSADEPADLTAEPTDQAVANNAYIQGLLELLSPRDRKVIYLTFYEGLTQAEIAEQIGVSQVHVSRIIRASLAKMAGEDEPL